MLSRTEKIRYWQINPNEWLKRNLPLAKLIWQTRYSLSWGSNSSCWAFAIAPNASFACGCLHLSGCTNNDILRYCRFTSSTDEEKDKLRCSKGFNLKQERILSTSLLRSTSPTSAKKSFKIASPEEPASPIPPLPFAIRRIVFSPRKQKRKPSLTWLARLQSC